MHLEDFIVKKFLSLVASTKFKADEKFFSKASSCNDYESDKN